jgi:hypothetical protein
MRALVSLAKRIQGITVEDLIHELSDHKEFTDLIIELNTQKQLFDKGEDSRGVKLSDIGGDYSAATIYGTVNFEGKIQKGLPYDRVTLFDTGQFYESFFVYFSGKDLVIGANTIKDGTDLLNEWGENILGLSEESLVKLREAAIPILKQYIKKLLLKR